MSDIYGSTNICIYGHIRMDAYAYIDILQSRVNMPTGTYNQVGTYAQAYIAGGTYIRAVI